METVFVNGSGQEFLAANKDQLVFATATVTRSTGLALTIASRIGVGASIRDTVKTAALHLFGNEDARIAMLTAQNAITNAHGHILESGFDHVFFAIKKGDLMESLSGHPGLKKLIIESVGDVGIPQRSAPRFAAG